MVSISEAWQSRDFATGESASGELRYVIHGTGDDFTARALLDLTAPAFFGGLFRQSISIHQIALDAFAGTASYGKKEKEDGDTELVSWDTSGGTTHITQSLETIHKLAADGDAPDFKGAIGVTEDNQIEGTDIVVPQLNFTVSRDLDAALVSNAYIQGLAAATGTTNQSAFRGLPAGSVLFLGSSGQQKDEDTFGAEWRFAAASNLENFQVGQITVPSKKAWEYLWVRYSITADDASKSLIVQPKYVYVERVYQESDFSQLGIET